MPESLRRVNPVLPDALDTRVWEGNNQSGNPRKQRGDRRDPDDGVDGDTAEQNDLPASTNLIDVRV